MCTNFVDNEDDAVLDLQYWHPADQPTLRQFICEYAIKHHYRTTNEPPQAFTVSMFYTSPPAPTHHGVWRAQYHRHYHRRHLATTTDAIVSRFSFAATTAETTVASSAKFSISPTAFS